MMNKALFPQVNGLLHGCDYNPEQWLRYPEILQEDIRLMKKAGINSVTLGVFAWSFLEATEGHYDFSWLKSRMDALYENGIYTVLASPSGGRPIWIDEQYPEVLRVDDRGIRRKRGFRHNHCMTALSYREKVRQVNTELARALGQHPALLMWHVSNEFGGECFCPLCVEKFRTYLKEKFQGDIDRLNEQWWTSFWSHRFTSFEQIEPPFANGENSILGLRQEWKRFTTWNHADFLREEVRALKAVTPNVPVTTNFMGMYNELDYHLLAKEIDVISWDSYPEFHNPRETLAETMCAGAFNHVLMRSMKKDRPFMLMESTPSVVCWRPVNKPKQAGVHRLSSLQAIACGSDTVQYFQWRKGRGGSEQYHGAVVDHNGRDDTRVFREVAELGADLGKLAEVAGSLTRARVAVFYDWNNAWALEDVRGFGKASLRYSASCMGHWAACFKRGVEADVIATDADLSPYRLLLMPMMYTLKPGLAERLRSFVAAGGILLGTYLTAYVNENLLCYLGGFPGDGLKELFGLEVEEIDSFYPDERNVVVMGEKRFAVRDYAERVHLEQAEALGVYGQDFYRSEAAVSVNAYGKGKAFYCGARFEEDALGRLVEQLLREAGLAGQIQALPDGVEYHLRYACDIGDANTESAEHGPSYHFYLNHTTEVQCVCCPQGEDLLSGRQCKGELVLDAYAVACIKAIK